GCGPTLRSRHLAELLSRVVDDLSRLQTAREGEIRYDDRTPYFISTHFEGGQLAYGSELQCLRQRPLGILEGASPLVWDRLSHAWQRRRSRGCRARCLATLADDRSHHRPRRRRIPRDDGDPTGDQRPPVGARTTGIVHRALPTGTSGHEQRSLDR